MIKALPTKMRCFIVLLFLFQTEQVAAARFCNNTPKNFILRPDIQFSNTDAPADAFSYPYQVGRSAYYSDNVLFDYCWPYYLRWQAVITRPVVGQYNGQDVYDIGVPNIGVTFTIADSQESEFGEGVEMLEALCELMLAILDDLDLRDWQTIHNLETLAGRAGLLKADPEEIIFSGYVRLFAIKVENWTRKAAAGLARMKAKLICWNTLIALKLTSLDMTEFCPAWPKQIIAVSG
ncbi:hypothetical protein ACFWQX_003994 [Salmonella enterica]|uniref:hypothetical protein n=1 Tax=Salmonella enterica TaxID=28901 RepID=UPI0020CB523D|nr:hypothetical protein [Salmonella enterica]